MKILITGADIEQCGAEFQVIYGGCVVYTNPLHACCLCVALDRNALDELFCQCNVLKFRVA